MGGSALLASFTDDITFDGTVNTLESRATLQGHLCSPEKWAKSTSMKINKSKWEVLHQGRDKPKH